jgi:hypothetical protein
VEADLPLRASSLAFSRVSFSGMISSLEFSEGKNHICGAPVCQVNHPMFDLSHVLLV